MSRVSFRLTDLHEGRPEYNGSAVVKRSVELKQPIIWVAMNYRCVAIG